MQSTYVARVGHAVESVRPGHLNVVRARNLGPVVRVVSVEFSRFLRLLDQRGGLEARRSQNGKESQNCTSSQTTDGGQLQLSNAWHLKFNYKIFDEQIIKPNLI